jgi:hypothetical protein
MVNRKKQFEYYNYIAIFILNKVSRFFLISKISMALVAMFLVLTVSLNHLEILKGGGALADFVP